MKYLLVTDGTWGDTLPFMFLAKKLKECGHGVVVISNQHYSKYAKENDIPFIHSTSEEERKIFLSNKDLWNPDKGMDVIAKYTGTMFEKVLPIIKREVELGVDMIISHSFSYAAKTMSEVYNIPHVSLLISPIQLRSNYRLPVFYGGKNYNFIPHTIKKIMYPLIDKFILDPKFPIKINNIRKSLGLNGAKSFVHWNTQFEKPEDFNICLWSQWYAPLERDQIDRNFLVGFTKAVDTKTDEDPVLSEWIKNGEKPIAVTMGSGYMFSDNLLEKLKQVSDRTGERFIFIGAQIKNNENIATSINSKIFTLHQTPFSKLFIKCKLSIHHGGAGTLAQVISAGIPHIVIPQSHDQPDNASRMKENNLGEIIWDQDPSVDTLIETIENVLRSDRIKESCLKAHEKANLETKDGIERACDIIESASKFKTYKNSNNPTNSR